MLVNFQWIVLNARACILITCSIAIIFVRIFKTFANPNCKAKHQLMSKVRTYNEMSVLFKIVSESVNHVSGFIISLAFFIITISICCVFNTVMFRNTETLLLFGVITAMFVGSVVANFEVVSLLFEKSGKVLRGLELESNKSTGRRDMQLVKIIRSLRTLSIRPGNACVITNGLMRSYFKSLLENTIDLTLLTKT